MGQLPSSFAFTIRYISLTRAMRRNAMPSEMASGPTRQITEGYKSVCGIFLNFTNVRVFLSNRQRSSSLWQPKKGPNASFLPTCVQNECELAKRKIDAGQDCQPPAPNFQSHAAQR